MFQVVRSLRKRPTGRVVRFDRPAPKRPSGAMLQEQGVVARESDLLSFAPPLEEQKECNEGYLSVFKGARR